MAAFSPNTQSRSFDEFALKADSARTIIILSHTTSNSPEKSRTLDFENVEIKSVRLEGFASLDYAACKGCVLLDAASDADCLAVLEDLRPFADRLPVIVLADKNNIRLAVNAMRTGAFDVLEKSVDRTALQFSVREALDSIRSFAPATRSLASPISRGAARHAIESLTQRQREILGRIMQGQPNKIIAADLGISQRTAENHRAAIMRKLAVTSISTLIQLTVAAS
jgi:two-component system CheB/CheR fusion protein